MNDKSRQLNRPDELNRSYDSPEIRHQRQRTLELLDIQPGMQILDVGCGTGFLSYEMAMKTTDRGQVQSVDHEPEWLAIHDKDAVSLTNVNAQTADACDLPFDDHSFDLVTCTQVLLYVAELEQAIAEMRRVLVPGGRIAIIETDWRGLVMSSGYPDITEKAILAWDATVASPNLPVTLGPLLERQGFRDVAIDAIPLLNTGLTEGTFSHSTHRWFGKNAVKRGAISASEYEQWQADLERLGVDGEYFFCVNRFLFVATA